MLDSIHGEGFAINWKGADLDACFDQAQLFKLFEVFQRRVGELIPAHQHIRAVAINPHMPPVGGVGRPLSWIHTAHVGQCRPGEIQSPSVSGEQRFHHIRVVDLVGGHCVYGGQYLGHRMAP